MRPHLPTTHHPHSPTLVFVFQKNNSGHTPLMVAASHASEAGVRVLLDHSARVNEVSPVSIDGHTHTHTRIFMSTWPHTHTNFSACWCFPHTVVPSHSPPTSYQGGYTTLHHVGAASGLLLTRYVNRRVDASTCSEQNRRDSPNIVRMLIHAGADVSFKGGPFVRLPFTLFVFQSYSTAAPSPSIDIPRAC